MLSKVFCDRCNKKGKCKELCLYVEKYVGSVEVWDNNLIFTDSDNLDYINNGNYQDLINNYSLGESELAYVMHLKRLTVRQKECFVLYYFENMTQCQIADALSVNQRTVSYHLSRAKDKIVKSLENKIDYIDIDSVEDLNDDEKLLLKLYYIEDLTQTEIAKIINVSQPAIHKKLMKANTKFNPKEAIGG